MAGKRTRAVVRHRLLVAAANKTAKGVALTKQLFIPETFSAERKAEIAARRSGSLSPLNGNGGRRPLMLLVGEVKEVAQARFGQKLVIKHLPDMPLMLPDDVYRRLKARFAAEFDLADAIPGALLSPLPPSAAAPPALPRSRRSRSSQRRSIGFPSSTPPRPNSSPPSPTQVTALSRGCATI